jgi:glycosyltransferase involved in cell wall biosynthesis
MTVKPARKVVFFIPSLRGGGAEGAVVRLANALAARGTNTTILALDMTGPWKERVSPGVDLVALGTGRASRSLIPLLRFLRRVKPDVFISNLAHLNLLSVMAHTISASTAKLILVEHNHLKSRSIWRGTWRDEMLSAGIRRLYRRADTVLAVSQGVRRSLIQDFDLDSDQVRVLNNPVELDNIQQLSQETPDHPWFGDPSVKVVLGVGRLVYLKGWDFLIEALAILRRDVEARLILLGEGELKKNLLEQAAELGLESAIDIVGFQANPYGWMAASDVLALPSRSEGFGIVLVEAMAAGVPVVASDCFSGPKEILSGGSYGLLVPVGDVQALADAMFAVITQPEMADDLIEKAAQRAEDFDLDRVASQLLAFIDAI